MNKTLKVILFGSKTCEKCKGVAERLTAANIAYYFIDALADANQNVCDLLNVEDLPHVAVLDGTTVVHQQVTWINVNDIVQFLAKAQSDNKPE